MYVGYLAAKKHEEKSTATACRWRDVVTLADTQKKFRCRATGTALMVSTVGLTTIGERSWDNLRDALEKPPPHWMQGAALEPETLFVLGFSLLLWLSWDSAAGQCRPRTVEREYNLSLIATTALSVIYHVHCTDGTMVKRITRAMPVGDEIDHIEEPLVKTYRHHQSSPRHGRSWKSPQNRRTSTSPCHLDDTRFF